MAGDSGSGAPDPMLVDIETFHNPYAVLTSIRDEAGVIVDFAFVAVNEAAVADYELSRETLLQSTLLGLSPLTGEADLFPDLVHVVQTGEHLLKLDCEYPAVGPGETPAYYDIRVARRRGGLGLACRDVPPRYGAGRAVAGRSGRRRPCRHRHDRRRTRRPSACRHNCRRNGPEVHRRCST